MARRIVTAVPFSIEQLIRILIDVDSFAYTFLFYILLSCDRKTRN